MPKILAQLPSPSCYRLFPDPGIANFNDLVLIRFCLARDTRTCMGHLIQGALERASRLPQTILASRPKTPADLIL